MEILGIHTTLNTSVADTTGYLSVKPAQASTKDSIQRAPSSDDSPAQKTHPLSWFKIAFIATCAIAACAIAAFVMKHIFGKEDQAAAFSARLNDYRHQLNQGS